eukprot:CAMPEP_0182899562 /NCGR_PEP_ID=MMETSP0034_2-20130328/28142_1 /TAXON_ID=156128 /ORGANISM="Nephroselmis pyriformis, Strain CCMP717" /LENGTH=316 /DNA_ID=CAMNT_0025033597 /DNA_START=83 /DNA_END=1029 /DNA_ORIENTATION=-
MSRDAGLLEKFWLQSCSPLDPLARRVFLMCFVLYALSTYSSPLVTVDTIVRAPPVAHSPTLTFFPEASGRMIRALEGARVVFLLAVAMVVVGGGGRAERLGCVAMALSWSYMLVVTLPFNGIHHNYFVPTIALLALAAFGYDPEAGSGAGGDDPPRAVPGWVSAGGGKKGTPPLSGFARQLVMLSTAHCLGSAGVCKVYLSRWSWADGSALLAILTCSQYPPGSGGPPLPALYDLYIASTPMRVLLSMASLVLELGAPFGLLSRRWRNVTAVGGIAFHAGILSVIKPNFTGCGLSYLLLIDFEDILSGKFWSGSGG